MFSLHPFPVSKMGEIIPSLVSTCAHKHTSHSVVERMQFGSTCLNFSHKMRMSPTWKEKEIGRKHLNHSWQQCWSYEEEWEGSITWEIENEAELDSFSSRGSRVIELQFDCSETIKHWHNLLFEAQALPCQHNLHRNEGLWCPDISVKRKLASADMITGFIRIISVVSLLKSLQMTCCKVVFFDISHN